MDSCTVSTLAHHPELIRRAERLKKEGQETLVIRESKMNFHHFVSEKIEIKRCDNLTKCFESREDSGFLSLKELDARIFLILFQV